VFGDVTVVIPMIPRRREMLGRALESVTRQTRMPEAVIIEYDTTGQGAYATRNRALAGVTTRYVAWLDDDDTLEPNHLETCLKVLAQTGATLVYPGAFFVGRDNPLAVSVDGQWVDPFGVTFGEEQEHHLRVHGNFIPVTYVAAAADVRRVGGFPEPSSEAWPGECEDHGLLVRLLDGGARFVHVPERTWTYHVHGENTGGRPT